MVSPEVTASVLYSLVAIQAVIVLWLVLVKWGPGRRFWWFLLLLASVAGFAWGLGVWSDHWFAVPHEPEKILLKDQRYQAVVDKSPIPVNCAIVLCAVCIPLFIVAAEAFCNPPKKG